MCNYKDFEKFLQHVDYKAESYVFQTFHDHNTGRGRTIAGHPDHKWKELVALNDKGFGVAVTINEVKGQRRRSEDVVRIRAVWHEDDIGTDTKVFPLPVSLTVQTSPGRYHHYWLIDGDWPADESGQSDFEAVMNTMVRKFGCDKNATDIARALRLPGTCHRKGKAHLVHIIHPSSDAEPRRYTRKEVLEAFSICEDTQALPIVRPKKLIDPGLVEQEAILDALDIIPSDEWETWRKVGMALHSYTDGSEEGFQLWDEWSRTCPGKYDPKEQRRGWGSFKNREDGVSIGTILHMAKEYGFVPRYGFRKTRETKTKAIPSAGIFETGSLTTRTLGDLKATFQKWGHRPSPEQWSGLRSLAGQLEEMANGSAEPLYYLSSLDPGIGKSQTVIHFTRALLASPDHRDVSVLILLGRLAEIESYVLAMGLRENEYAVRVSESPENDALNRKGNLMKERARVLFTTQQMLESRAKRYSSFSDIAEFWFDGKPRQVRIWDETCLPARSITIDVTLIAGMTDEASKQSKELHDSLWDLITMLRDAGEDSFIAVPDLEERGVSLNRALGIFSEEKVAIREAVRDLYYLSGKSVMVTRNGRNRTLVHYENTLSDDIKPMVICDASGRVRQTYRHWSEGRGDLIELQPASKDYSNLSLHVWETGAGKEAWKDARKAEKLITGIVETVNTRPDEQFLIVHRMENNRFRRDIPSLICEKAITPDRLRFIHWGGEDFKATNKFKDFPNVILAGTLFYDPSQYEALGRLSRGIPSDEELDRGDRTDIEQGEHAHLILQAACRGAVRKSEGEKCGRCTVYIIAHPRHGITKMLEDGYIFPGAHLTEWLPVEKELRGRVREAVDFVAEWFAKSENLKLPISTIRNALGVADHRNFNKDVINRTSFQAAMESMRLRIVRNKGSKGNYIERMNSMSHTASKSIIQIIQKEVEDGFIL